VRTIAELFGRPEFPEGAFDASGRIRRAGSDAALEEVRLTLGETRAVIDGLFYGLPNPSMSDASLRISGPDFGQFDELLGLPGRLDGPFDIAADLIALETGGARLDMKGMVQAIELSIEGPLADAADLVGSELRLGLSGPDLSVLARAAGRDVGPEDPFTLEMSMRRISEATLIERGQGRVGEDHFSFSARLEDGPPIDWSLTFEAALPDLAARLAGLGIDYAGLPASAAEASGVIRSAERGYEIDNVAISFAGAELLMNGQLGPLADLEATDLAIRVSGPALARLLPPRDAFGGLNRPFTVTANTRINASEIAIEDAALEMDGTTLHGSLAFELDDILGRGRFSVETNSPGVLGLWPPLPELSVDPAEPFALRVAGDWAESVWNLGAFDVDFPDGSLTASGTTTGPPNFEDTNLSVDWAAPNLNVLGALTGRDLPDESTRFHFELTGDRDELTISNLRGVIGASDVRGEIVITRGDVPTIAAELTSELIDLDPYVPPELETAVEADGERINPDGRWIPDVPVDIETLQGISATANIRASDIRAQDRVFNNLVLEGSILNGQLRFDNFDLEADGGTMQGALTLRPGVSALELGLRVSGENLSVGFFSLSPHDPESFPRYELDLALAASGNTVREMAATTNGYLSLVGGPGRLRSSAIRFYTRDFFSELLDALNPFSATDPELDLNCTVVLAAINDGRLAGDPALVMQSDRVTVYADALFDLDSERVDVNLRTVPRRGLGVSLSNLVSPYVKIGGTLASPSIALDPEGALIEGGIAAATGGASMLAEGLWERFLRSGDPCSRAISYADGELQALQERLGPVVSAALE
jgi:hypothetical protein